MNTTITLYLFILLIVYVISDHMLCSSLEKGITITRNERMWNVIERLALFLFLSLVTIYLL
jgi:hypothetical protein